ncbi:MAG: hypothetical protein DRI90_06510 [Deltaproteobacteria bacterium]|nr:MAG: hypothetical protein DRI90_06510 [Deltaproteobacteria bacterium]
MTKGLVGIAVFICALLFVSSAFAGSRAQVHQRARLDHYARPAPHQARMLHSRMQTRAHHQKARVYRSSARKPMAIQRLRHRARLMDDYRTSRVQRHVARTSSRRHMKGPARLTRPPRLMNKIRCAELGDQCLPQASKSSAKRATKASSTRPRNLKNRLPAKLRHKRDSVVRCPDGDCSL